MAPPPTNSLPPSREATILDDPLEQAASMQRTPVNPRLAVILILAI
jgi:hypothetical protein